MTSRKTMQLGFVVAPMTLVDIVREVVLESITNRLATIWQEQHPQEHLPADVEFKLDIEVDLDVVRGIVEDATIAVVRKLETVSVEVP